MIIQELMTATSGPDFPEEVTIRKDQVGQLKQELAAMRWDGLPPDLSELLAGQYKFRNIPVRVV